MPNPDRTSIRPPQRLTACRTRKKPNPAPLAPGRRLIAVLALIIFILCFTPVPIESLIKS